MEMGEVEIVIEPFGGSADPGILVEGAERAAFETSSELRRPRPFLGDDVDDAADCISAVKPALRPTHDLDALDVPGQDVLEIEGASGRIGRVDAVDKDLGLVRICTANEDPRSFRPDPRSGRH